MVSRFPFLLQRLNKQLAVCLPFVDFSLLEASDGSLDGQDDDEYRNTLGLVPAGRPRLCGSRGMFAQLISLCRGLVFSDVKLALWQRLLTTTGTASPLVSTLAHSPLA